MKRSRFLFLVALTASGVGLGQNSALSDSEIEEAIALGRRYKTPEKLWDHEFKKTNGLQRKTAATVVRLEILTDSAKIARAASLAAHETRPFALADARALPDLGKLTVLLRASASGYHPDNAARWHLLLEVGDQRLQPESKAEMKIGSSYEGAYIGNVGHASQSSFSSCRITQPLDVSC